ncbi:MAG TPA: hypothetical protein DHV88_02175 [Roseburia sp.]|nr:hypothetical protein [Roseburia sp.]
MAVLVDDLKKKVLENTKESDQVIIITGYFSPDMIDEIAQIGIPFVYYYGMYGMDKIAKPVYDKLVSINNNYRNLNLKFVHTQRVHTKCYLFYKNNKLVNALVGSANCSINGLCSIENSEMLIELNEEELKSNAYLLELDEYAKEIEKIAIDISDPMIIPKTIKKLKTHKKKSKEKVPDSGNPLSAIMPLYQVDKKGKKKTYKAGGPNWGNQNGNVATKQDAMEAYIPILTEHLDKYPLLFQPYPANRLTTGGKVTRKSDPVTVIWDDGEMMTMTFQGSQRAYPSKENPLMVYPKQLSYGDDSTRRGGAVLGKYLRKRMNVDPFHVITITDLKKYGRDYILLTYVSPGLYTADFSGTPLS